MKMGSLKLALGAGIAGMGLAGCGGGEVEMQPGRYEMTSTIEELTLPGAPPEVVEGMKEAAQQPATACLTQEDVKNPGDKLTPRSDPGAACSENRYDWKGGKIDGRMRCDTRSGEVTAEMSGEYRRDGFTMDVKSELPGLEGEQAAQRGRISLRTQGRRIGECDGTENMK